MATQTPVAESPAPSPTREDLRPSAILYAIVALTLIAVAAVVGISVGGADDSTPLISSIIGLVAPTIGVLLMMVKLEQVHRLVNSKSDRQEERATRQEQLIEQLLAERDAQK